MKRLHIHVSVAEIGPSIAFYAALFGAEPVVRRPDYAQWLLDDPRVNFAISSKADTAPGLDHLGVQVETDDELAAVYQRLGQANIASQSECRARCCYAESDKHWAMDPSGIVWEAYRTMGGIAVYGDDRAHRIVAGLAGRSGPANPPTPEPEAAAGCCP